MRQVVGDPSEGEPVPLEVRWVGIDVTTEHELRRRGDIVGPDEDRVPGPVGVSLLVGAMRALERSRRAVAEMFETMPLIDYEIDTPLLVPAVLGIDVPRRARVSRVLAYLFAIMTAQAELTEDRHVLDQVDEIMAEAELGDQYTFIVVSAITRLTAYTLYIHAEGLDHVIDPARPADAAVGPDGPAWRAGLVFSE